MSTPEEIAREVVQSTPTPERLADLDAQTIRVVTHAAERAGVTADQLWAASRAASAASLAAHAEADRIAELVKADQ